MLATLLCLADGRLPAGGHVHSGGIEEAVNDGRVATIADLGQYLLGRLHTVGVTDAGLAAATRLGGPEGWAKLDAEAAARCPVLTLRSASRSQGRGLLRAGNRMWPGRGLEHAGDLMWPVALGACAAAADLDVTAAAVVAAQSAVSGPAWAAVRLLGLDPLAVAAVLAALAPAIDDVAADAVAVSAGGAAATLPALSSPVVEVAAVVHTTREVQLFAS